MGIDAVAVLRIANLVPPATEFGTHGVEHRGDASLIATYNRFDAADPDEHALNLRRLLGSALDAHDDPRGILFFGDVGYPNGMTYEAIVSELTSAGGGGVWAPRVEIDYVPVRYRGAPRQPHDALVGELIAVMGRDAAVTLDMIAQVNKAVAMSAPDRPDAVAAYRDQLDAVTRAMGSEFAASYETSLQAQVDELFASQNRPPIVLESIIEPSEPDPHDALVAEMIRVMGHEAAARQELMAWDTGIAAARSPDDPAAVSRHRTELDAIANAMGTDFAQRYEASLKQKVDALLAEPPGWPPRGFLQLD